MNLDLADEEAAALTGICAKQLKMPITPWRLGSTR